MPDAAAARAAVLDLLGLLTGVRDRLDRAPVRRGRPDRLTVWREVLSDRSAAAFPRQLALHLRAARERVAPLRDALRAARAAGPYPSGASSFQAATGTEFTLVLAAEVLGRLDDGLPPAAVRAWLADDEVADLARRLEPLLAALPADLADQIAAEFMPLRR